MARRNVPFIQNSYYHIYNRGAHRMEIFRTSGDYLFLLKLLKKQCIEYNISVLAYCLMPNHYHFLLRQDSDRPISDFMQAVFNIYSKAFNTKHLHSGTLFEGPFKAILVDKTEYLLHLCRYIHRNPINAGLVSDLTYWEYSNYLEFIGKRSGTLINKEFVSQNFGAIAEYEKFVLSDISSEKTEKILRHYLFG